MSLTAGHVKIVVSPDLNNFEKQLRQSLRRSLGNLRDTQSGRDLTTAEVVAAVDEKQARDAGARAAKAADEGYRRSAKSNRAAATRFEDGTQRQLERIRKTAAAKREQAELKNAAAAEARAKRRREEAAAADLKHAARLGKTRETHAARTELAEQQRTARAIERAKQRAAAEAKAAKAAVELDRKATAERERIGRDAERRATRSSRSRRDSPTRHFDRARAAVDAAGPKTREAQASAADWMQLARSYDRAGQRLRVLNEQLAKTRRAHAAALDVQALTNVDPKARAADHRRAATRVQAQEASLAAIMRNIETTQQQRAQSRRGVDDARWMFERVNSNDHVSAEQMRHIQKLVQKRYGEARYELPGAATGTDSATISALAKRLLERNGNRARLPEDTAAISAATSAARDRDRIETAYQLLLSRRQGVIDKLTQATLDLHRADRDQNIDLERKNKLIEAYNVASQAYAEHRAKTSELSFRRDAADVDVASGANRLRSRLDRGTGARFLERIDLHAGEKLKALNDKVIYVGRSLASMMQIAVAATVTVAALGAVKLVPLLSSASQALTTFAALPAVLAAVGTGIASVAVGFSGIGSAVKAASEAAEQDSEARLDALERERDAQRSLEDARENASDTYQSGQRQIASAERSVQSALTSSERAQKSLNAARKAAVERIRDVNDALRGTALDERGAVLALKRAERNITDLFARGGDGVTGLDVEEAVQARDEAAFNLDQVRRNNEKKRAEAAETNQKGVEGSDAVISAKEALADSRQAVIDAQENAVEAVDRVSKANADAAERVVAAQEKVAEAARELAKGTTADQKLAKLMAQLSPQAQGLVRDLIAAKPALHQVKLAAQDALTNGLGASMTKFLDTQLPLMKVGFAAINSEINTGLKSSLSVLSDPATQRDYVTFLTNTRGGFRNLVTAAAPLTRIFTDMSTAGSSVLPRLGQAVDNVADRWSARISLARDTGELNASIDRGIDKMRELGQIVANTFGGIRGVFAALHGEGDSMTARMAEATKHFEEWAKSAQGAAKVRRVYEAIARAAERLNSILGSIGSIVVDVLGPVADNFGITLDVAEMLITAVASIVNALMGFGPAAALIESVVTAFAALYAMRTLSRVFDGIKSAATTAYTGVGVAAISAREKLGKEMERAKTTTVGHFAGMRTAAATAVSGIGAGFRGLANAMGGWMNLGVTAALVAISLLNSAIDSARTKWVAYQTSMRERGQFQTNWAADLQDALNQSGGVADENVRGVVLRAVQNMRSGLDTDIDNKSTFWQQYGEQFNDNAWWNIGAHMSDLLGTSALSTPTGEQHTPQAAARDRLADAASSVRGALEKLNVSDTELTRKLSGSDQDWQQFREQLVGVADGGELAAERLDKLRETFNRSKDVASRLTATIDNMKSGYLEASDAVAQLTANLNKQNANNLTVDDARVAAYEKLNQLKGFKPEDGGGALFSGDEIDVTTTNGQALYQLLREIGSGYNELGSAAFDASYRQTQSTADATAAAQAATADIVAAVRERLAAYGLEGDALEALARKQGLAADSLTNALSGPAGLNTALTQPAPAATPSTNPLLGVLLGVNAPGAPAPSGAPLPSTPGVTPAPPAAPAAPTPAVAGVAPAAAQTPAPTQPPKTVPIAAAIPDYTGSLKAYRDYVGTIEAEYKDRLAPAFDGAIEKAVRLGTSLVDAVSAASPKLEELVGAIGGINLVFRDNITDGALSEWAKLRAGMDTDVRELVEDMLPKLVGALDDIAAKFASATTDSTGSFAGMKRAVAEPINWLINNVFNTALKNAWNEVRKILPSLPEWSAVIPPIPGYNRGGVIPGYEPGVDDRIVAVGKGEAIMRPEFVRAYGPDWINEMNAAARRGGVNAVQQIQGAYAGGGIVDSMRSAVAERWPNMALTSGLRFTDNGYHSKGMAADFSNGSSSTPEMQQLAAWIRSNFLSSTLQLIHNPFAHNILNMRDVGDGMTAYTPGTMAEHGNHVHWALARALGDLSSTVMPALGSNVLGDVGQLVREQLLEPMAQMRQAMNVGTDGMSQVAPAMFDQVMGAVQSMLSQSSMGADTTAFDVSAGARQWRPQIIAALQREGWEVNERNIALTEAQIDTESGGNPNIIQTVQDVNSGGNEGVGLLQVIPGTFAAHRNPSLPNDRTNPDANLSAALRYYRARWGNDLSTMWGKGHGYDQGGWLPDGGFGWNRSGKPEPVFTNDQWQILVSMIDTLRKLAPGVGALAAPSGPEQMVAQFHKVVAAVVEKVRGVAGASADQSEVDGASAPAATDSGGGDLDTGMARMTDPGAAPPDWVDPVSPADQGTVPADTGTTDPYLAAAMELRKPEHYMTIFDKAGKGFLEANWNQFTADLGITGEGFLSQAVRIGRNDDKNLGVEYIQKQIGDAIAKIPRVVEEHIHYHVADMDEALRKNAIRQRQESMSFISR
ncbi:hypothetical protein OG563_26410 [Nocardia vinacea]|uniref:Tape measure protein n=1 Tax=Nocardia vinacea TaxID=96468 RepID=A0ABZ1YHT2_9NOCA|nr:hypothetical protein [Nocardia vinacea]